MTDHHVDLLPVIVEREQATLPDGFDTWGLKSVRPDLRTYGGYQWPYPGNVAEADDVEEANTGACPRRPGDGLCVATSWRGMASGGIPARTLLLVATASTDVLGRDDASGKSRHRRVAVVALVDGERLLREAGRGADLRGAYLGGADLGGADLGGAYLGGAGADLGGALPAAAGVPGGRPARRTCGEGGTGRGVPARGVPGDDADLKARGARL